MSLAKFFFTTIIAASIIGCSSTPKPATLVPVKITSLEEYKWDKNISFAMNMVQISKSAGIGYGLKDTDDPNNAKINRISAGENALDMIGGFMAGGFVSALAMSMGNGAMNEVRNWSPAMINLVPVEDIQALDTIETKLKLRKMISDKIVDALKKANAQLTHRGTFGFRDGIKVSNDADSLMVFGGEECIASVSLGLKEKGQTITYPTYKRLFEKADPDIFTDFCYLAFSTTITGQIEINGNSYYTVVSEIGEYGSELYLFLKAGKYLNSIQIFPSQHNFYPGNKLYTTTYFHGVSYVRVGERLFSFDKNEISNKEDMKF